jgi:hypothetical protein
LSKGSNQSHDVENRSCKQAGILLLAAFVPWLANLVFILGISPFAIVDPTPLAFAITGIAFFWGVNAFIWTTNEIAVARNFG